jgi:stearoyl-CoA desaturase (Delta-9 desaturase)
MKIPTFIPHDEKFSWGTITIPFIIMHIMPFFAIFTGVTWTDVLILVVLYFSRIFFITIGFHRYFAHRAYKMNRFWQFVVAFLASTSAQKGVLGWAGYHRHHHHNSDQPEDIHSPLKGFWWSHMLWFMCEKYKNTPHHLIPDFAKYPELRWLDRHHIVPATILGLSVLFLFGPGALFIGFFLSTVLLYHGTFFINSLTHIVGRRRYVTNDSSRNSFILALITGGEGWHNNHHHFAGSARHAVKWWEFDFGYLGLKVMELFGVVRDLRLTPKKIINRDLIKDGIFDTGLFHVRLAKATDIILNVRNQTEEAYREKRMAVEGFVNQTKDQAKNIAEKSKDQAHAIVRKSPKPKRIIST